MSEVPTRDSFPSNQDPKTSDAPPEKPKLQAVTTSAVQRKMSIGRRIKNALVVDDAKSIGAYLLEDVVIPTVKTLISDIAVGAIERALYGEARGRPMSSSRISGRGYTPYNRIYSSGSRVTPPDDGPGDRRELSRDARRSHDFGEIVFESRAEAYEVLDRLNDQIKNFDVATVGDLLDLSGITATHVDENWGWRTLATAQVRRVRNGYILDLERPVKI
ncbi:hypothetical protein [uncultured Actinomyces sp.]|uniref:hypothetical protein n=1 Tax=uncultured Actinomyces sp. TaxID=249061 RepID=UPI0028D274D6|nr:hypothetical protein [uncultured Actinomyces sp.]